MSSSSIMTQTDGIADALAAASLRADETEHGSVEQPSAKPSKASFASALQGGQTDAPSILTRGSIVAPTESTLPTSALTAPSFDTPTSDPDPAKVDDTILQAMRKRDDRIFFSQYENQMSGFVRDATRSTLELGAMNTWQRLLIHRCADQFQLDHQLDRATHCITLSKTPSTSHPSVLLSVRARDYLVHRNGINPSHPHPALADPTIGSADEGGAESSVPSASASSRSSPAPGNPINVSTPSNAPPLGFKIMRRDPSSSRQPRLLSADTASGNTSDSEKVTAAKARKDMTLEEREASYKAARARIFADLATSSSPSPTSPSTQLDLGKDADALPKETKHSPSSSAASSPVASIAGGRSSGRRKVPSSSSSVASQEGISQRARGSGSNSARRTTTADADDSDDLEFCRALPPTATSAALPFGAPHQSSPLAVPAAGHGLYGYFPPTQAGALQQSQSNPNLRSGAPSFHPGGCSTPAYARGGALRYPDVAAGPLCHPAGQTQTSETDAFPALPSSRGGGLHGKGQAPIQTQQHQNGADVHATGSGGVWNRGQEHLLHGVGAWAEQTSAYMQTPPTQRQQPYHPHYHQQQQQQQPGFGVQTTFSAQYPSHMFPQNQQYGGGQRNVNGSRASSQRGASWTTRDDAMSVGSVTSTASSRSTSFSGANVAGNATTSAPAQAKGSTGAKAAFAHPSLPARPAWIGSTPNTHSAAPSESG